MGAIRQLARSGGGGVLPGSVINLAYNVVSTSQIDLTYDTTSSDYTGFIIEKSTDNVNFAEAGRTANKSFSLTGLTGNYHYFRVCIYKWGSKSVYTTGENELPLFLYDGNTKALYRWDKNAFVIKDGSDKVSEWSDYLGGLNDLLQADGLKKLTWTADGLYSDGNLRTMKTSPFTWNQPCSQYLLVKPTAWSINNALSDGNANQSFTIRQSTSSPNYNLRAGAVLANQSLALDDQFHIFRAELSGTFNQDLLQIDSNTPVIGDAGNLNPGGFSLGRGDNYDSVKGYYRIIILRSTIDTVQNRTDLYTWINKMKSFFFNITADSTDVTADSTTITADMI